MIETIEQMTCEELTSAYVILRELENKGKVLDFENLTWYISMLKRCVSMTHKEKLEDMRKAFYEGRNKQ